MVGDLGYKIYNLPLYLPHNLPQWVALGTTSLFIYYDVKTDDVDTDAHGEDNYVYGPLVKYKNYLPLTWKIV